MLFPSFHYWLFLKSFETKKVGWDSNALHLIFTAELVSIVWQWIPREDA